MRVRFDSWSVTSRPVIGPGDLLLLGGLMDISLSKLIHEGMQRKPNNVWPVFPNNASLDRTAVVTASEIGGCELRTFFDKEQMRENGYSPTEGTAIFKDWGYAERGHVIEAWAVENIRRANDGKHSILFMGEDQRSFVVGIQSATPDGVILLPHNGVITFDIKSIDPRKAVRKLPDKKHIKQVTQAVDLVSQCMDRRPIGSILIYIEASDISKHYEFFIPFDVDLADELYEKANKIANATSAKELQAEGVYTGECGMCPFAARCSSHIRENKETSNVKLKEAGSKFFG